jgi:hypothetical protein
MSTAAEYLQMAIIYKHPTDHPTQYVVREWRVGPEGEPEAAAIYELFDTAAQAQAYVRNEYPEMECVQDQDADPESCVFEVWR